MYYTGGTECLNAFHFPLISPQISFFPASGKILKNTQHWFSPDEIDSIWREKKIKNTCVHTLQLLIIIVLQEDLSPPLSAYKVLLRAVEVLLEVGEEGVRTQEVMEEEEEQHHQEQEEEEEGMGQVEPSCQQWG